MSEVLKGVEIDRPEKEYGTAFVAEGNTVADAVAISKVCEDHMWMSVVDIVLKEGRGRWIEPPTMYGFGEGPRSPQGVGDNGYYWYGVYLPYRSVEQVSG